LLHVGHARTFWIAAQRAAEQRGTLVLRNEDLDPQRCRAEFVDAMFEDLRWLGIGWQEGPDCGGPFGPYAQSERSAHYLRAWRRLRDEGKIYPCSCSRKDLASAASAPNDVDDEPVYPGTCRARISRERGVANRSDENLRDENRWDEAAGLNWRFLVPDGEAVEFVDGHLGPQRFVAGRDFGDFLVWRRDGVPSYQLAAVVDDAAMQITEVVRGADLLKSAARQILLCRALGTRIPAYYHCDLVRDDSGVRLAKRHDSLSIRALREQGWSPEEVRAGKRVQTLR
jgi:glutamyl/glutaminyl-tRNA synthetase